MRHLMLWNPNTGIRDPQSLIDAVTARLAADGSIVDAAAVADALKERERMGSTRISQHLALPHAACAAVSHPTVVFVRLAQPLGDWEPGSLIDRWIFLLLPQHCSGDDAEEVRRFCARLGDEDVLHALGRGDRSQVREAFGP